MNGTIVLYMVPVILYSRKYSFCTSQPDWFTLSRENSFDIDMPGILLHPHSSYPIFHSFWVFLALYSFAQAWDLPKRIAILCIDNARSSEKNELTTCSAVIPFLEEMKLCAKSFRI